MSGHSRWTQIKRQKGVTDARRSQRFTKLAREITVAARAGGADPEGNPRLRLAVSRARQENMPLENIERAIKKGSGEATGEATLEELLYEGYGPGGAAILVFALTDNRNRTASEVRRTFERHGGRLSGAGSVAWLFDLQGLLTLPVENSSPDELALLAIDAGALDVRVEPDVVEVSTRPEELEAVRRALEQGHPVLSAEQVYLPKTTVALEESSARQVLRLLELLEEMDDIQHVHCNAEFPNTVLETASG